ncbi:aldehyde dehydrogenase family protein [Porticoccaceae bacterium]|nr:aldehyde dehydrogenase family protein [Porticoccaceae bacterium]
MTTNLWLQRAKEADFSVHNFINGRSVNSAAVKNDNAANITKYSPRDGRLLYSFSVGGEKDVVQAVDAARESFDDGRWSGLSVTKRKSVLQKLADLIVENQEELAFYDCLDVGKPITSALNSDISLAVSVLRDCAEGVDKMFSPSGTDKGTTAYQCRKPVGVVGAIIGWNYPLFMASLKVGPALAMGNSLVLKPSEYSPLSAIRLAELAFEAGVPPGVFNVVNGAGSIVGKALAYHPKVDLLTFTGSSATGKQMMVAAGRSNMKRLLLECGGKSPLIVFDDCSDAHLDTVAGFVVEQAFANQGENCKASSRLLVQNGIKDRFVSKVVEQVSQLKVQDPFDPNCQFGALINEAHMNKVLAYIDRGKEEGAKLILGGNRSEVKSVQGDYLAGYFIEPTIFDDVDPHSAIAQDEIFGPVLAIISFKDETEAIRIANDNCFGLAAYAATENLGIAQRLGCCLNVGQLMVIGSCNPDVGSVAIADEPQQESGFGFEKGLVGLASYTVSTAVTLVT